MSEIPAHVEGDEELHRALNPRSNALAEDGRVHYMAFYSSTEPWRISVDRARYRVAKESLRERTDWRLARLLTETVRGLPFEPALTVDSVPEDGNDAHAEIVVDAKISKTQVKTKVCVKLAEIATVLPQDAA